MVNLIKLNQKGLIYMFPGTIYSHLQNILGWIQKGQWMVQAEDVHFYTLRCAFLNAGVDIKF